MERNKILQHPLVLVLFICMHGASMLAQNVETSELLRAMASKGGLASVLPERR